jgi:hypothetical protein
LSISGQRHDGSAYGVDEMGMRERRLGTPTIRVAAFVVASLLLRSVLTPIRRAAGFSFALRTVVRDRP